ncbi:MAG: hypothetical protein KAV48_01735 [Methanomicrobia archaeon]|nr:hypothetical protein [Methanomicrobia archaeon]MCK4310772.1 hypothetical protein [Methanomicrobia archaeon]MCK4432631.1 hypothetical protein [Methanomicrobia archaeon]MCK4637127.1 hypothetical protein [Methanomicrobia archaeon]
MRFFLSENLCSKMQLDSLNKNELILCLLGLNELEGKVLLFLLKNPNSRVVDISESLGKHRTSVQKTLSQLINRGLIMRKAINLRRGYNFVYYPISKEKIKENLLKDVETWSELVKGRIMEW